MSEHVTGKQTHDWRSLPAAAGGMHYLAPPASPYARGIVRGKNWKKTNK